MISITWYHDGKFMAYGFAFHTWPVEPQLKPRALSEVVGKALGAAVL